MDGHKVSLEGTYTIRHSSSFLRDAAILIRFVPVFEEPNAKKNGFCADLTFFPRCISTCAEVP